MRASQGRVACKSEAVGRAELASYVRRGTQRSPSSVSPLQHTLWLLDAPAKMHPPGRLCEGMRSKLQQG